MIKFFLTCFFLVLVTSLFAQSGDSSMYRDNRPQRRRQYNEDNDNSVSNLPLFSHQRFYVGGGAGLSFGNETDISVSPLVGYRITDRLSTGVQLSYDYLNLMLYDLNGNPTGDHYSTYNLGAGIYARFYVFRNIFAHVQYEENNFEAEIPNNPIFPTDYYTQRITVPSLLVGGGFSQPIGRKSTFTIMLLYDILQQEYSPYSSTPIIIRAGFNFGL